MATLNNQKYRTWFASLTLFLLPYLIFHSFEDSSTNAEHVFMKKVSAVLGEGLMYKSLMACG